ncbi:MAG: hypothetical protein IPO83_14220 [Chitinophagaceae bacterium]|nr:hypothetical protein [Chitinophagaceae bacterium]
MEALTENEFLLLDELYFVTSFGEVLQELAIDKDLFLSTLTGLLAKGFVIQLNYNDVIKDFEKLEKPDLAFLESSSFVASREGLLIHNSR